MAFGRTCTAIVYIFFLGTLNLCVLKRAQGQLPYVDSYKNATAKNLVISGSARLTASSTDPAGEGYLRLTDNSIFNVGYVYGTDTFPSNFGITASFEFFSHKPGASATNQADGMTFFLFDASVNAFRPGGTGGSLGYAQYYSTPGMAKGYIGVSIDGFGNFSSATDGSKNGGPGQRKNAVAVRGPGNGRAATDYVYQTGVVTSDAPYNIGFNGFVQRYPDSTHASYRRIKIILTPGSSLGASLGYKLTVIMYKGGNPVLPVTLISNFDYPFVAPRLLQFGLSASTGSIANYHEIRNLSIEPTITATLLPPVLSNDPGVSACYGQTALIDVTANDTSKNSGGTINKTTVDLDPVTAGIQKTFTDPGKGVYSVDSNGIVAFQPVTGFTGMSSATYHVSDTYGQRSILPGTISFNVSNASAPLLTIADPAAVCFPATVDITLPGYKTASSPGATYSYYRILADANSGLNAINATANVLSTAGTYYIKASLNGCSTIKPIVVKSSITPSIANAGADQNYCSSTGGQAATLLATNPENGVGSWTQISGPAAVISYPDAATTPLYNLSKGVYVFRHTVSNGVCTASSDEIQVSVGVAANAGAAQTVVNASTVTLAGNIAAPAVGVWSQISGPSLTITDPSSAASTLTSLTPGNTYVMQWRITNGACNSTSQVTINNVLNTIADAGADQLQTGFLPVALQGNSPGAGNTGLWTVTQAPAGSLAVLLLPGSPNASLTNIGKPGDYTLRWTISNGSYSNYDEMSLRVTNTLPVTWVRFSGAVSGGKSHLSWTTGSEIHNDHFNIERSVDGVQFSVVGRVTATNRSTGDSYTFIDDIQTLTLQRVWYRIAQVDTDGRFSYSDAVAMTFSQPFRLSMAPNPVRDVAVLSITAPQKETVMVLVSDVEGRLLLSRAVQLVRGKNTLSLDGFSHLPQGLYYVRVTGQQIHQSVKVLKQ